MVYMNVGKVGSKAYHQRLSQEIKVVDAKDLRGCVDIVHGS